MGKSKEKIQNEALAWQTGQRKVSDLMPYEHNPRTMSEHQAGKLKESLVKFGLVEIPAINTDGTIVAGHMRLKIMTMLGRGEELIDVRIPNRPLTADEVKEYNIRSNKNTGMFDKDMLANEFDQTQLIDWGFEQFEFGVVEEKSKAIKEKTYSIGYEIIFDTEADRDAFKNLMKDLSVRYPDLKTEGDRLIRYIEEHGI